MTEKLREYWSIFSTTNFTHYLSDNERVVYLIYLAALVIVFPVSYAFGSTAAIVISIIISTPFMILTLYGVSWGKADWQFFEPEMIGLVAVCFIAFGSEIYFANVARLHFASQPVPYYYATISYLVVFVTAPVVYYLYRFYTDAERALRFIIVRFEVCYDSRLPIYVKELIFLNSKNAKKADFYNFSRRYDFNSYTTQTKFEKLSLRDKFLKHLDSIYFSSFDGSVDNYLQDKVLIPRGTDKFIISWYSFVEDKYYSDEFPFPLEKMQQEKWFDLTCNKYVNAVAPITFEVFSMGNASLSQLASSNLSGVKGRQGIYNFIKIEEAELSRSERAGIFKEHIKENYLEEYQTRLKNTIQDQSAQGYSHQLAELLRFYDWSVSFFPDDQAESTVGINGVHIINAHDEHLSSALDANIRSSLPRVLVFVYNKKEYAIYLDVNELLNVVKARVMPSASSLGEPAFKFEIYFDSRDYKNSGIKLALNSEVVNFPNFQIHIEYTWEE